MATRKQLGTDYLLFVNTGTSVTPIWKALLCQTNAVVNTPFQTIDANSKCGPDSMTDFDVQSIEVEGQILQFNSTDTSRIDIFTFREMVEDSTESQTPIMVKLAPKTMLADDEGKIIYSASVMVTSVSDTYGLGEVATASISMNVKDKIVYSKYTHTT